MGLSINGGTYHGWFIEENRIKMDDLGGTPISGNLQVLPTPFANTCWLICLPPKRMVGSNDSAPSPRFSLSLSFFAQVTEVFHQLFSGHKHNNENETNDLQDQNLPSTWSIYVYIFDYFNSSTGIMFLGIDFWFVLYKYHILQGQATIQPPEQCC